MAKSLSSMVGKFIENQNLFQITTPLVCAISGGIDSMVMLDVLRRLGFDLEVAHVNYKLRGVDSDRDQRLVENYCNTFKIVMHTYVLDQKDITFLQQGNLQDKARQIRYAWMDALILRRNREVLCVGHHKGDVAETFILHALRGAGSQGLRSIQHKVGHICRPLLCLHPDEISQYADQWSLAYRHDRSNEGDQYDRNFIRNQTLQRLQSRWPSALDKIAEAANHISHEYALLHSLVKKEEKTWIKKTSQEIRLGPLSELYLHSEAPTFVFLLLKKWGFNYDVVTNILNPNTQQGALFTSDTYTACKHQDFLLIRFIKHEYIDPITIPFPMSVKIPFGSLTIDSSLTINDDQSLYRIYVQLEDDRWPLILRPWKSGDTIQPLGMNGKSKKVSDILIDQKLSYFDKRAQLVIEDNNAEIIWVIGRTISHTVQYKEQTSSYLTLEYKPSR